MNKEKCDFKGWATKYNIRCADGRTIIPGAFSECNGKKVPVVWSHQHDSPEYVLGHAILECRDEGVYAYGFLNDTKLGKESKELLNHGDIDSLSIYANRLTQDGAKNVHHGYIRELSLVLAGANPGASIDYSMAHSDDINSNDMAAAFFNPGGEEFVVSHDDLEEVEVTETVETEETKQEEEVAHAEETKEETMEKEKTVEEVFNGMMEKLDEDEKQVLYALVGQAAEENNNEGEEEMNTVKHNAFEGENAEELAHELTREEEVAIFDEAKRAGSLKETSLAHGITNIGYLFPDNKAVDATPRTISRNMEWVDEVINRVHKTPFARIKSIFSNITAEEARAKGYLVKGTQKVEEVISMLKRTTDPTTVYKLQKLDRDDIIDITDYDVVAYIKREMQIMLNEELARAILFGDGRSAAAADKINETHIRPIWKDESLFTIRATTEYDSTDTPVTKLNKIVEANLKSRKYYKGSGNCVMFTTEDLLVDFLLMKDVNGRTIYENEAQLAKALRVTKIVTVPVMEGLTREGTGADAGYDFDLQAIVVNMGDYNVGADKLGNVNMFDDFDINFNKYEYLIETRCSGALTVPYSAIVIENKHEHVDG